MYLLADMFSRIKIATLRKLKNVVVLNSKTLRLSLSIIYSLGYLISYKILNIKYLKLTLKYFLGGTVIRFLSIITRPGYKTYITYKSLKNLSGKTKNLWLGFIIVSTSQGGLKIDIECIFKRTGGTPLFFIS